MQRNSRRIQGDAQAPFHSFTELKRAERIKPQAAKVLIEADLIDCGSEHGSDLCREISCNRVDTRAHGFMRRKLREKLLVAASKLLGHHKPLEEWRGSKVGGTTCKILRIGR